MKAPALHFWAYGIIDKNGRTVDETEWCIDRSPLDDVVAELNEDRSDELVPYSVVRLYWKSKRDK